MSEVLAGLLEFGLGCVALGFILGVVYSDYESKDDHE